MPPLRVIPSLQIYSGDAVKTSRFGEFRYVGSPVNAVSIFSSLGADGIHIVGLDAARKGSPLDKRVLQEISANSRVPLSYSGGLSARADVQMLFDLGFEKVFFGRQLINSPYLVRWTVDNFGSQAVGAVGDFSKAGSGYSLRSHPREGRPPSSIDEFCEAAIVSGVGEILANRWDLEGTGLGLDHDLVASIVSRVDIPLLLSGGFSGLEELSELEGSVSGIVAGHAFTFSGPLEAVLLNFPSRGEIVQALGHEGAPFKGEVEDLVGISPSLSSSIALTQDMCGRCIMTSDVPGSDFQVGVCYYCRVHDSLELAYSGKSFADWAGQIKRSSRKRAKYDCILGVSGGADSSYLLELLVDAGVRVLAVHFDNGWNSPIATMNIHRVTKALGVDLETFVADHREYDDLYKSFLLSGVRDIEAPTDIAFMGVLYRAARTHGIQHIVEGHSFRTEGMSPLGWLYMDGGYVPGVHRRMTGKRLTRYPNMSFVLFVYWAFLAGIQRHRPLYFIDYRKDSARKSLSAKFGWQWYGGHHLENRFTAFFHSRFLPRRYGIDYRQVEFSALVRSGFMNRTQALEKFSAGRLYPVSELLYIQDRLGLSDLDELIISNERRSYSDFPNYKALFRLFRPIFWCLMKLRKVPETFYLKYCAQK